MRKRVIWPRWHRTLCVEMKRPLTIVALALLVMTAAASFAAKADVSVGVDSAMRIKSSNLGSISRFCPCWI